MEREQALQNYAALVAKVDAKFEEIRARNQAAFQCARGCHGCCKPGLTVGALEADALRRWLAGHPEARARIAALAAEDPHRGTRCRLLEADGSCAVYEARPIVCRSHGAPLQLKDPDAGGAARRDVCPLNFGGDPTALPPGDVINLDTLNTILALIASQHGGGDDRVPLASLAGE